MAPSGSNNHDTPATQPTKPSATKIPGVEDIAQATRKATRRMAAVQRTSMGKRILNVVRNLIWVIPLTLLIWLYAERENVITQSGVTMQLSVKSERPDRFVSLVSPADGTISLELTGTRPRIQEARNILGSGKGISFTIPAQTPLGRQVTLPALESIASNPVFADRGITVSNCSPVMLTLYIDELQSVEARPQPPANIAARFDGAVVFDPPTARLVGPKGELTNPNTPVEVIAHITDQMLPKAVGIQEIQDVPLRLAEPNEHITITPNVVKAKVRIRSAVVPLLIPSIPVFVSGPVSFLDKYRVVFPQGGGFMRRITVIGPEEQIHAIDTGKFAPKAVLEVGQQDLQQHLPRVPTYVLPEGVKVIEDDKNKTVDFDLIERTRAE